MKVVRKMDWVHAAVFLGPALILFAAIKLTPFLIGMYYSFTDWNGVSNEKHFVGLRNFLFLLHDPNFLNSFLFTVKYTLTVLMLSNSIAFLLAFLLTRMLRTRNIVRTVVFMPNVVGGILLGFIWQFIFLKGFPALGHFTHLPFFNLPWLGTSHTAFWGVSIVSVWQLSGYLMIIYIAGITSIPNEVLESAEIDGAGTRRKIFNIVIPLIMPVVTVCLFLTLSESFKVFDLIFSLTKGGPFQSTETVAMDIYYEAYNRNNMGIGSAKALIFFVGVSLITLTQVWFTRRKEVA